VIRCAGYAARPRISRRGTHVEAETCDTVRVIGSHGTAKIRAILTAMHGALLEKQIDGFRRWNLIELRLVKRAKNDRAN
jgi:hypothetical protein